MEKSYFITSYGPNKSAVVKGKDVAEYKILFDKIAEEELPLVYLKNHDRKKGYVLEKGVKWSSLAKRVKIPVYSTPASVGADERNVELESEDEDTDESHEAKLFVIHDYNDKNFAVVGSPRTLKSNEILIHSHPGKKYKKELNFGSAHLIQKIRDLHKDAVVKKLVSKGAKIISLANYAKLRGVSVSRRPVAQAKVTGAKKTAARGGAKKTASRGGAKKTATRAKVESHDPETTSGYKKTISTAEKFTKKMEPTSYKKTLLKYINSLYKKQSQDSFNKKLVYLIGIKDKIVDKKLSLEETIPIVHALSPYREKYNFSDPLVPQILAEILFVVSMDKQKAAIFADEFENMEKKATIPWAKDPPKGAKKVAAKKTGAKKVAAKKTGAKKVAAKKTGAKKVASPVAKKTAKKVAAKKVATKVASPVAKKVAAKKTVAKKAAAKKAAAKKVAAKK